MGTKQFSNYESLLTFTRASKGHALRPVSYGTELVTNGTFDSDTTGWTNAPSYLLDTFELDAGRLHIENTAGTTQAAYTDDNISLVAGKIYRFTAELEKAGGSDNWEIDIRTQGAGTTRYSLTTTATTETLQVIFVATQTENTAIQITTRNTFEGYIDNVSVKEVTFDESDGTLTLFEHPDNIPRVEWDAQRNRLGLLVEESRTNLIYQSEDFTDSNWVSNAMLAFGSGSTSNAIAAPDGTTTADLIVPDTTSSNSHWIRHGVAGETIGNDYTISVYVKAAGYTTCSLRMVGTDAPITNFDLSAETTDQSAATITNVGNGWYRCTLTGEATSTTVWHYVYPNQQATFAGDGTSGIYIWGAQLEEGSFPTSYIKTTGATATRSADVASIPVADFGFNADAGSILIEYQTATDEGVTRIAELESDANNRVTLFQGGLGEAPKLFVNNGGVSQADYGTANVTVAGPNKLATAFKENDTALVLAGGAVAIDTTVALPIVDTLLLGNSNAAGDLNGHIKSIKYYPRRLTNAQLQELTS